MQEHQTPEQELHDELTAYLDGELDADHVKRVEERLARDAGYRDELHKLERTWALLDRLPRATVDEAFTRSTIEMVAVSASQEAAEVAGQLPQLRLRRRMIGIASMLAALLVGFGIGSFLRPDSNEHLLRDLPVVENLDLYYQADDIEFLRLLDKEGLFQDQDSEGRHAS